MRALEGLACVRLQELVRRWVNHKLLVRFLSNVFKYLVCAVCTAHAARDSCGRGHGSFANDRFLQEACIIGVGLVIKG